MNLFDYVVLMKEQSTPVAITGVVLLALFLLVIILKMLGGMRRGGWRQLVRTSATLLAAIVSYIFAVSVSNGIIGSLDVNSLEGLIVEIEKHLPEAGDAIRNALASINTDIVEYMILLPATIILVPILATVAFLLINLVLKIVRAIIIKIVGFKKAKNNTQRLSGAVLAAVEALIWITMVMLPICGALTLVDEAYSEAIASVEGEDKTALTETYDEYLLPFTQNPAVCFVRSLGTDVMADGIATVKIGDERTNMRKEVLSVAHLVLVEAGGLKDADFAALSVENKDSISAIIDTLYQSPFISHLLVGSVQSCSALIDSGILPINIDEENEHLLNELVVFLEGVSRESLGEDLNTVKKLYFALSDSGILSEIKAGNSDIMSLLNEKREAGDDVMSNVIGILKSNDRTKALMTSITKVLISSISTNVTVDGVEVEITYDDVKESMKDVLLVKKENFATEEEYKEELTNTLDKALTDNGIELEDEVLKGIADHIDENYSDFEGELSDEEFNDILLEYYDAYLEYLESGENPEGLEGVNP